MYSQCNSSLKCLHPKLIEYFHKLKTKKGKFIQHRHRKCKYYFIQNKYFFLLTFGIAILVGLVFFLLLYSKAYATIMASLVLMGLIFLVVGIPSIRYGFTIDDTRSLSFFNLHEDFSFTYLLLGFFMSFLFLFLAVFATKINTN